MHGTEAESNVRITEMATVYEMDCSWKIEGATRRDAGGKKTV